MKIEIGENLVYTWLRHVRGCRVTQLNWKSSPLWDVSESVKIVLESFMKEVNSTFSTRGWDIFKKTKGLSQLLKQVECDVFGIYEENGVPSVIVAESAFHENGLNYGSKEETCAKVIAKMAKAAIAIYAYLPWVKNFEVIFASPKVNSNIMEILPDAVAELSDILRMHHIPGRVSFLANEAYRQELLIPVMDVRESGVADSSELFLRSIQLLSLYMDEKLQVETGDTIVETKGAVQVNNDEKIGKIVKTVLKEALEKGCCSDNEINLLMRNDYSRQVFGLNFPLLSFEREMRNGVYRYYKTPLTIKGQKFYLCSQWYEKSSKKLENWLARHR